MKKYYLTVIAFFLYLALHAQDWKAQWISTMECQSATNTWLAYRKTVDLQVKPEKAIAKIAVDSKYWLWVNGQLIVFEGGLKRGPNPLATYYDEVDIAPFLKTGKNTVAVLVWYFGKDGFSHKSSGRAGLIFDCQSPGFELLSDNSWKCSLLKAYLTAGEPLPNFRLAESSILYDARKDIGPWQTENYDERNMSGAMVLGKAGDYPWNNLVERPISLWKVEALTQYENEAQLPKISDGKPIIALLPRNITISPYLKIKAPAGLTIDMRTDNFNGGGEYNFHSEYITKEGVQEFESLPYLNGHWMIYGIPAGVEILELRYRE
ncbi:glycoside hydrolase, partial [bacterium]|nr:glycoside hydrolase [bacterium]